MLHGMSSRSRQLQIIHSERLRHGNDMMAMQRTGAEGENFTNQFWNGVSTCPVDIHLFWTYYFSLAGEVDHLFVEIMRCLQNLRSQGHHTLSLAACSIRWAAYVSVLSKRRNNQSPFASKDKSAFAKTALDAQLNESLRTTRWEDHRTRPEFACDLGHYVVFTILRCNDRSDIRDMYVNTAEMSVWYASALMRAQSQHVNELNSWGQKEGIPWAAVEGFRACAHAILTASAVLLRRDAGDIQCHICPPAPHDGPTAPLMGPAIPRENLAPCPPPLGSSCCLWHVRGNS